jgi:hypothetical protein
VDYAVWAAVRDRADTLSHLAAATTPDLREALEVLLTETGRQTNWR